MQSTGGLEGKRNDLVQGRGRIEREGIKEGKDPFKTNDDKDEYYALQNA